MLLYRYQPINKYTIENLIHNKNWASNPSNFNDPFEFNLRSDFFINNEHQLEYITKEEAAIRDNIKNIISKLGVVSCSETENNILLWSHYSDNHKGMCLVFDVPEESLSKIYKVKYEQNLFDVKFIDDTDILGLVTTKSKAWSYEKEHRQIFQISEHPCDYPSELKEIIFGCQSTIKDIKTIIKICDSSYNKNITFSKTHIQQDTFNLSKSSVSNINSDSIPKFWDGKYNGWERIIEKNKRRQQ